LVTARKGEQGSREGIGGSRETNSQRRSITEGRCGIKPVALEGRQRNLEGRMDELCV
jgi:hypothetical protein